VWFYVVLLERSAFIMKKYMVIIFALVLSFNVAHSAYADVLRSAQVGRTAVVEENSKAKPFVGDRFARTELYFGTARPDGDPPVSEAEFQGFLNDKITSAFPDGLTLLKGLGQFRGADGVAIEEDSFLVILLYPVGARRESSAKIEQIRTDYKTQFQQESVLRSDFCCERVGF
jgi:hypothetical protein